MASPLFTKIIWWIPIFVIILIVLYGELSAAITITLGCLILASREFIANRAAKSRVALVYFCLFIIWMIHIAAFFWYIPAPYGVSVLIAITIISILSDVVAFFLGNYLGRHHLPKWINPRKSWEGVAGQIIGAMLGGALTILFLGISVSIWFIIAIGVASAVGDICNSIAKRSLRIKDWGTTIPGHGGVLDRLSSLSLAVASGFWIILLT